MTDSYKVYARGGWFWRYGVLGPGGYVLCITATERGARRAIRRDMRNKPRVFGWWRRIALFEVPVSSKPELD